MRFATLTKIALRATSYIPSTLSEIVGVWHRVQHIYIKKKNHVLKPKGCDTMEEITEANINKSGIEGSIVRWALPRENIPFHIKINNEIPFDKIIVHLPKDFKLVEAINVGEYKIDNGDITILSVKKAKGLPEIFWGLVVTYIKIPDTLKFSKTITIDIIKNNKKSHSFDMECRIFRPMLKVMTTPESVELSEEKKSNKIPLELQYIGFGDIQIGIEARIGGNIVSKGESLVYEVLLRLYERGLFKEEEEKEISSVNKKNGLYVEPNFVREVVEELQRIIDNNEIPSELLDEVAIEELKEYLSDMKNRENFTEIIFGEVNTLLLSILRDILERNPEENIELRDARTRIKTKIDTPIENIQLKISYSDLMMNEYEPIEVLIPVNDKLTTHKNTLIELPIKIEKIDNKPLLNVKDISMEDS